MASKGFNEDQWRHIYQLAQAAIDLPESQRLPYLESVSTDPEITREVLELVANLEGTDDEPPSRVGTTVGRFEIRTFLGSGGAGEVFSAYDPELRREVAIKILRPEQSSLPDVNERFIREARAASALNHPNIVTVHEVIRSESSLAIVMEHLNGEALRHLCGKAIAMPQLLSMGQQAADALAAAHAAGVVHRDIKPENLMLVSGERIKVLDFGLARLSAPGHQTLPSGIPAGTLRYMSPEHYHGHPLTAKSDVFALGLVLYELATGHHPFGGKSSMDVLHAIALEPVNPPATGNATVDQLILQMLAKAPSARPTAEEVASQLRKLQLPSPAQSAPASRSRWILGGALAVLLLGILGWKFYPSAAKPGSLEQITHSIPENRVTAAAISSDGKYLTYANSDGIFLQLLNNREVSTLKGPEGFIVDHLTWIPDGTKLIASGFSEDSSQPAIWTVSITGAPPRLLRNDARFGTTSADGKHVAFLGSDYSSIWTMDVDGQAVKRIVDAAAEDSFLSLYWAANSQHLLVNRRHYPGRGASPDQSSAPVYSLESIDAHTGAMVSRKSGVNYWTLTALADGDVLLIASERLTAEGRATIWSVEMDLASGEFTSEMKALDSPVTFSEQRGFALTATRDGSKLALIRQVIYQPVFVADFHREALRFSNFHRLTLDDSGNYPHAWTGDSQSVIYESNRAKHSFDLFKQHLSQRVPEAIMTTPKRSEVLPQLTPDQKFILYAATREDVAGYSLMRIPVEGGVAQEVPIGGLLDEFRCSPQPKGRCVLRKTVGVSEFVYYHLDPVKGIGPELARVAWWPSILGDWDLSPDGRFVAVPNHDPRSGKIRLVRVDPKGKEEKEREIDVPLLTQLSVLTWAADGTGWFVSIDTSIGRRMYFYELTGHLTSLGTIQGWAVPSPDGKKVAFLNNITQANAWIFNRNK